jgi:tetratricopeptide (TPR) repeat protein
MSDAEVHVLWARLRDWDKPPQRAAAQADLDEAIRIAPEDPETWLARGNLRAATGDSPGAEQDLKRAAALAPEAPRYLYPLASFRSAAESSLPPEQQVWDDVEPLVARLQKTADSTSQRNFLANYWLARGRPERAAAWATKAIDADASCAPCYETASSVLAAQGKLCDAVIAQRVAINLMPEELRTKARMDRLRALTKAIKEANACPKAP